MMTPFNKNLKAITKARSSGKKVTLALHKTKIISRKKASAPAPATTKKIAAQTLSEKKANADLEKSIKNLFDNNTPQSLIANWDARIPVLLMPLRLETRFMDVEGRNELWLRIYPDDIAIQQHDPILSEKEFTAGKKYWMDIFDAERNETGAEDLKKNAWEGLKSLFGANRSSWIARQTNPVNWKSKADLDKKELLIFPGMPVLKTDEWTQAPKTQVLPDKFVVNIFKNTTKVHEQIGNLIPDTLFLGNDPLQGDAFTKSENRIDFAKEFSWMSDFEEAVNIGMGFKIELKDEFYIDASKKLIDSIVVLGIYLSADADHSEMVLSDLLQGHRYTEGLAIVPQGTPTNNTEDDSSGFIPNEDPQVKGYFDIPDNPPFQNDPLCDGNRLVTALGIEAAVLEGILNDTCHDHAEAVTMNRALFPATIGYYLDTLLDNYVADKYVALTQMFFENNVTAGGPLPAIRIGDQPYGILITSSFPGWKTSASDPDVAALYAQMQRVLTFFSSQWDAQVNKVLYVGRERDANNNVLNADDVFLDVVGLEPSSVSFERKTGYLNDLPLIQTSTAILEQFKTESSSNASMISRQLASFSTAVSTSSLLLTNLLFKPENKVYIPEKNLIDGLPVSEGRLLKDIPEIGKNYLSWLAGASSIETLEKQDFSGAKAPNYLLYLLARHSLLLELRRLALAGLAKKEAVINRSAFDKTYLNLGGIAATTRDLTIWEVLYADLSKVEIISTDRLVQTLGDMLLKKDPTIASLKSRFASLSALPTARLERLLTGHLDCLNYRLDAWQTGMFHERLNNRRNDAVKPASGIYLGAFGYLENLMPAIKTFVNPAALPTNLQPTGGSPVISDNNNAGLIQGPSLDHAAAAALLMSGYRNHATPEDPGIFAVNLSSSRIRKAMPILEGVRNGQSLEALLGYQFERALHERTLEGNNLNQFVLAFREKYTIENQYNKQEGEADTDIFKPIQVNVVNGLKIAKESNVTIFADIMHAAVPSLPGADLNRLFDLLVVEANRLADALDAITDLLLSESVFQAASGNTARTGAVLEALREGSLPPDPGILKTPRRSRFAFNNLISIHFPQKDADTNPWGAAIPLSPKSRFEPGLNFWLSKILGNPANILCSVNHVDEDASIAVKPKNISLADLKIQPLDFLMYSGKDFEDVSSELNRRISHQYRVLVNLPFNQKVDINFSPKVPASKRSFLQILTLAKALYTSLSQSRAIHAGDYMPFVKGQTVDSNQNGIDISELEQRVNLCIQQLEKTLTQLDSIVPNDAQKDDTNPADLNSLFQQWATQNFSDNRFTNFTVLKERINQIIDARINLAAFDISNAWPTEIPDDASVSVAHFLSDTANLWRNAHLQLDNAKLLSGQIATSETDDKAGLLTRLAKILLGAGVPVMPKFNYQNSNDIASAFKDRKNILASYSNISGLPDAIIPDDWLHGVSEVRQQTGQWELARSLAETFGSGDLSLQPIQLPYRKNDSWLAVQFPKEDANGNPFGINTDTISCAVFGTDAFQTNSPQSGLLIDEWSETIPVDNETSGIAFNYNQPDSMPPQALLLAVYPGLEENWSWDALLETVMDTFKRAKMRAVEPRHFDQNQVISHLLPGIIAPVNISGNNISLDFAVASDEFLKKLPPGIEFYAPHIKLETTQ